MTDRVFIDSNIWIYSFINAENSSKQNICIKLLERIENPLFDT